MSLDAESDGPSLQDSLKNLYDAFRIISEDSKKYYFKDVSQVSDNILLEIGRSFVTLSDYFRKFRFSWNASMNTGPDAVYVSSKLDDRIDMKILNTGKLDFEQLKKIMSRLNRADDALWALNRMDFYLSFFRQLCQEKGNNEALEATEVFIKGLLNPTISSINSEIQRFRNQIDRCNLYYQNRISTRTYMIAWISLLISVISIFLSTLSILIQVN